MKTPLEQVLAVNLVETPLTINGEAIQVVKGVVHGYKGVETRLQVARLTGQAVGRAEGMISVLPDSDKDPFGPQPQHFLAWSWEFETWDMRRREQLSLPNFRTQVNAELQGARARAFNDIAVAVNQFPSRFPA